MGRQGFWKHELREGCGTADVSGKRIGGGRRCSRRRG
jgi:hypothetical protein